MPAKDVDVCGGPELCEGPVDLGWPGGLDDPLVPRAFLAPPYPANPVPHHVDPLLAMHQHPTALTLPFRSPTGTFIRLSQYMVSRHLAPICSGSLASQ